MLSNRGYTRHRLGQHDAALADFDAALQADATLFDTWCHRALLLAERGLPESALASFGRALQLQPEHRGAMLEQEDSIFKRPFSFPIAPRTRHPMGLRRSLEVAGGG